MDGKRGLSDVIANVIIILLVMIAIGIIAAVVIPLLKSSEQQITSSASCISTDVSPASCNLINNSGTYSARVLVHRGSGSFNVNEISIISTRVDGSSQISKFTGSDAQSLSELTTKAYDINFTEPITRVQVGVQIEGKNDLCPISQSVDCLLPNGKRIDTIVGGDNTATTGIIDDGSTGGGTGGGNGTNNGTGNNNPIVYSYNFQRGGDYQMSINSYQADGTNYNAIFPNSPAGSTIFIYNPSTNDYRYYQKFSNGDWSTNFAYTNITAGMGLIYLMPNDIDSYSFNAGGTNISSSDEGVPFRISQNLNLIGGINCPYRSDYQSYGLSSPIYSYTASGFISELRFYGIDCDAIASMPDANSQEPDMKWYSDVSNIQPTIPAFNGGTWGYRYSLNQDFDLSPEQGYWLRCSNNVQARTYTPRCAGLR